MSSPYMACCQVQNEIFDGCVLSEWLCIDSVKMYKQNYNLIQTGMIFRPYQAWSRTKRTERLTVGL